MSGFISDLKDELKSMVKMTMPTTVREAAEKARLQELTLEAIFKKNKSMAKSSTMGGPFSGVNLKAMVPVVTTGGQKGGFNAGPNRSTTLDQRRMLGLCFRCGEKYSPGHQCRRQLFKMEGGEGNEEEALDKEGEEDEMKEEHPSETLEEEQGPEGGEISFHALKGGSMGKIIKVKGQVGKKKLMVLIDSGSTHSFLNEATAKELGCKLTHTNPLSMIVANGHKMYTQNV